MSGKSDPDDPIEKLNRINDRIANLERQSHAILFLSAINMFINVTTIIVGVLLAMP